MPVQISLCSGEGEDPILGILEVLDGKRNVDSVANIAYLDGD